MAALIVHYVCYYAKMLSQKMQGIRTDQIGKDKSGFSKFVEVAMKIAAILVVAAEIISIIHDANHSPFAVRIIGAAMCAAGIIIFIIAMLTMRDNRRAGVSKSDKTELVTNGIYRFSRNPAFLGFDLFDIGMLLMYFNPILCVLTAFAVIMYHLQIVYVEEEFLLETFGDEYTEYKKKVFRYFGRKR